jgi:hypothetical protein
MELLEELVVVVIVEVLNSISVNIIAHLHVAMGMLTW